MKIKHPYSIRFQILLVLGLVIAWGASSLDGKSITSSSLACEEVDECIEEVKENARGPLVSVFLCDHSIFGVETECFMQFSRMREDSVFFYAASHPSGWMMPLRI